MMKRLWSLFLCVCVACAPLCAFAEAASGAIPVALTNGAALVDAEGRVLVAPGTYDMIYTVTQDDAGAALLAAGKEENGRLLVALTDGAGNPLTEFRYDVLVLSGDVIVCSENDLFGALDRSGRLLVPPEYSALTGNGEGGLLALKGDVWDDQPDGVYYIGPDGKETATGVKTLTMLDDFSEGRVALQSAENSRYGYLDATGSWAVRPQYAFAAEYVDGFAIASISSGFGLIDRSGNWVLTPRYDYIWRCDRLYLATLRNSECIAFDAATLEERFRVSGENLFAYDDCDRVVVSDDAATRLYDQEGNLLWTASAEATLSGTEKDLILVSEGPWGSLRSALYSADGRQLGESCQLLYSLGVVDGTEYFAYMAMDSEEADEDWTYAPSSALYGIMNDAGNAVTEAMFSELYRLDSGAPFFYAATEAQEGLVSPEGEWITVLAWKDGEE